MSDRNKLSSRSGSAGKYFAIGCLSILVVLMIGGFIAYRYIKGALTGMVDQYTDTEPRTLPTLTVSQEESRAINARVDSFKTSVASDQPAEPLVLTADDINKLIQAHPDMKEVAGKVFVSIDDDKIRGEISIPLDLIHEKLKGRYLNGSAVFTMQLSAGRLLLFIDSMEVKGKTLPDKFMQQLRAENMARKTNEDPELAAVIAKLESITVNDGKLQIVSKKNK